EHADFPKLEVERHVRQVAADVLDNRATPSRIDFAEKHQRQMHVIRTYPFDRRAAAPLQRRFQAFLLLADRRSRRIVKIDRDEQTHLKKFGIWNSEFGILA